MKSLKKLPPGHSFLRASQVALVVKNLPAKAGDRDVGLIPGWEKSPGGGHGNPLRYFAWRIQWTEESSGLQSVGSQRVGHDWGNLARTSFFRKLLKDGHEVKSKARNIPGSRVGNPTQERRKGISSMIMKLSPGMMAGNHAQRTASPDHHRRIHSSKERMLRFLMVS